MGVSMAQRSSSNEENRNPSFHAPLACHPEERISALVRGAQADATKDLNLLCYHDASSC